jgi:hypothetical protein
MALPDGPVSAGLEDDEGKILIHVLFPIDRCGKMQALCIVVFLILQTILHFHFGSEKDFERRRSRF